MELIAATRVAKAQQRVQAARPYSEQITSVIQHMAEAGGVVDNPLLRPAETVRKVAYVVVTGARGLAGASPSHVIRPAERAVPALRPEVQDHPLFLFAPTGATSSP